MQHFYGNNSVSIDAKNRLAIPAEHRALLDPVVHGTGWVAGIGPNGLLTLWPTRAFESLITTLTEDQLPDEDTLRLRTALVRNSARLDMDAAGRVRIPDRLMKLFRLGGSAQVLGAGNCLEVMSSEAWAEEESQLSPADVAAMFQKASRSRKGAARP